MPWPPTVGPVAAPGRRQVSVHNGADQLGEEMRRWHPSYESFDASYLPERETLVARTNDLVRDTPMLGGAIRSQVARIVGDNYRMQYRPALTAGALTPAEAVRLIDGVEEQFRLDAEDDGNLFDASGRMNFTELNACALVQHMMQGEVFSISEFRTAARDRGRIPFATGVSIINPDRVVTPPTEQESPNLRSGFRLTNKGYAFGAYVLNRHPGDYLSTRFDEDVYRYITRETPWGRARWQHLFITEAPDQTRGRAQLVAGIRHARMLQKFETAALSNAITQSLYAAVVKSADPRLAMQGLMGNDPVAAHAEVAQAQGEFYSDENELVLNGAKIAHLFPGDELEFKTANQNLDMFDPFEAAFLRHLARLLDVSYEELSGDYTKTNYSGARAGALNSDAARETLNARVPMKFSRYLAALWLEEQCSLGRIPGVPGRTSRARVNWFLNNKQALCRFRFFGPGTRHIDPVKGTAAAKNELQFGGTTLSEYLNTYTNRSFRETVDEMALEKAYAAERGVIVGAESVQREVIAQAPAELAGTETADSPTSDEAEASTSDDGE